jgi:hypothetical protein
VTAGLCLGDGMLCLGVYNPPSIFTLYASPVKSYGGDAGVVFFRGAKPPFGLSNVVPSLGGGTPLD